MSWLAAAAQAWLVHQTERDLNRLRAAMRDPRGTQHAWLLNQVRRAQDTGFGRDHYFREMQSVADFRRRVPIGVYEDHEPYIERVKRGDVQALFSRERVRMFALTSGTTNARKFIPVTDRVLHSYRRAWTAWGLLAYSAHKSCFPHARMTLSSDWDEFRTPAGVPCGSISGLTAQLQNWLVRRGYVLPAAAGKLSSTSAKYYLAWRLGATRTIGSWIAPNPSTLLQLARFGAERATDLLRDIHNGTLTGGFVWPQAVRRAIAQKSQPQPRRARELEQILQSTGGLRPRDVWPDLQLIGCWTGGSMGAYLRSFPEHFGDAAIRDLGLIASEGRMTFPLEDHTSSGALEIFSGFFEFVPVEEIHSRQPTVLEAHELREGGEYYILLTTASGLYRYNICDVVRCTGWCERTPLLAFLHKGSSISSITGEKLTEHQVVSAVSAALSRLGRGLRTFSLAPCWKDSQPFYGLFVEEGEFDAADNRDQLAALVDRELQQSNIEYAGKRTSARLGSVQLQILPVGAWDRWIGDKLAISGGSIEQYKHPCLIPHLDFQATMPVIFVDSREQGDASQRRAVLSAASSVVIDVRP